MSEPAEIAAGLPHLPGVYRMLDKDGVVLYVGKALDLRKRVSSYFQRSETLSPRIRLMVAQIMSIETTVTRSEAEALLLENNLIKSLAPRYNILFRDDKSYPYLMLTGHRYPRLGFFRGNPDKRHRYFGPFPDSGAVRASMQLLQKVFRLRTCEDSVFTHRSRPCLLHQIHRCTAPCVGLISDTDYAEDVHSAELFLSGQEDAVSERLDARMIAAAEGLRYEEAAVYRDQIGALRKVRERQYVSDESGRDADVIACGIAAGICCVNLVMIRGGRHLGDKNFFPQNADDMEPAQIIEAFIAQHYLLHPVPPQLVVGEAIPVELLQDTLSERAGRRIQISANPIGSRRAWLQMATKNAELGAAQRKVQNMGDAARLIALQQGLGLPETVQRIECFDISHTQGEATVASCVVYDRGAMQNGEYRHFNMQDVAPGDDYGAMREVLTRRYRRAVAGEGKMPDLVMIDGGQGQLGVAIEVLTELGLSDVPLLGVAKGEARKPGMEQLLMPGRESAFRLGADDPGLHLIQQIRDEAHRFAIEGHRARRARTRNTSPLEGISGVGAKRRQRLLTRFGGLRGLVAASVDELAQVDGISRALAERIYDELH
ncbi:MAG: excinuclease ABC subunit UvrC [Burkholderiales bacterium]|jgi:excinuclease ABC subunit C|nr:excinuclease ABC subunit UvrC [Burkholderiales bacterium]